MKSLLSSTPFPSRVNDKRQWTVVTNTITTTHPFGKEWLSVCYGCSPSIDATKIQTVLPPYIQQAFHSFHSTTTEHELLLSLINSIISFNPDILTVYEVFLLSGLSIDTTRFHWLSHWPMRASSDTSDLVIESMSLFILCSWCCSHINAGGSLLYRFIQWIPLWWSGGFLIHPKLYRRGDQCQQGEYGIQPNKRKHSCYLWTIWYVKASWIIHSNCHITHPTAKWSS